ncbi:hypothetical protein [Ensifer adhaerens]
MSLKWKNMNWLVVAGVLTVAYAAVVGYTLGWSRISNFITADETDLNAVGDFTAGIFAPIALLWLVAAVFTQRQELNETRDQFEENQKVVDAQLKTINSQNELLDQQHKLAIENAQKAYRLSLFDKRLSVYQRFVMFDDDHNGSDYTTDSYWQMLNLAHEAAFIFDQELEEWLSDIAEQINDYVEYKMHNPFEIITMADGHKFAPNNEFNDNIKKECASYTSWISEQFLPEARISKFWKFMHVSDEPYVSG